MRVIAGKAKGRHLITNDGRDVRPTPERVKEGIFSALQFDLEGRKVLDLFGGSGQLGIEALSRGAAYAVFADQNPVSVEHIKANLENTGFTSSAKVIRGDFSAVLMGLNEQFDYVFLDPPYASGFLLKALNQVRRNVSQFGKIICEHPKEQELPECVEDFVRIKQYKYGKVFVSVYARQGDIDE